MWDTHQHSVIGLYLQMPVAPPNQDNQTCIQGCQIHPFENKSSKEKESLFSKIPRAIRKIALSYYHHAKSAHLRAKPMEGNARDMKSDLMILLEPWTQVYPKQAPLLRLHLCEPRNLFFASMILIGFLSLATERNERGYTTCFM